jgi:hypothetical protein
MENTQQIIELIKKDIAFYQEKIEKLQEALKLLNLDEQAEGSPVSLDETETRAKEIQQLKETFKDYPLAGKHRDKIRYIIDIYNRSVSDAEIENVIRILEGDEAEKTISVYQRTIRGLTHPKNGELAHFNFLNDKTRFYAKRSWVTEDKSQIIPEKMPIPNGTNVLNPKLIINPVFVMKKLI